MARTPKPIRRWYARAARLLRGARLPVPERPGDAFLAVRAAGLEPPRIPHLLRSNRRENDQYWRGPKIPLGYVIEVLKPFDFWFDFGGWGDGPQLVRAGTQLWAAYRQGAHVWCGPDGRLGWFPSANLKWVRRIREPERIRAALRELDPNWTGRPLPDREPLPVPTVGGRTWMEILEDGREPLKPHPGLERILRGNRRG